MDDKKVAILLMENMGNFQNLIRVVNTQRYKMGRVLTEKQFFVMINISKYEKIELKNLSKELYVSTSSLCILLNKLVEQDYVSREEDCRDRRNTFYAITEKGREIIQSEGEKFISIIKEKMDSLDDGNKDVLFESLININDIVGNLL